VALRGILARFVADHVAAPEIEVTVGRVRQQERVPLTIVYHLASPREHEGRSLMLDFTHSFLEIQSVTSSAGRPGTPVPKNPKAIPILPTADSWDGETVTVAADWLPSATASFLPIPGVLPFVLCRSPENIRPTVRVRAEQSNGLVVGGLMRGRRERFDPTGDLIEAVLAWEAELDRTGFAFARSLDDELGHKRDPFLNRASVLFRHLEAVLGPAGSRFLWLPGNSLHPRSSIVSSGCFGWVSHTVRTGRLATTHLCSVWWEAGCRFVGAKRLLVEEALRDISMIRSVEVHFPDRAERMLDAYRQLARTAPIQRLKTRLKFDAVPRARAAALALAIHEASASDDAVWDALLRIGDQGWGEYVSALSVLADLGAAGVDLHRIGMFGT